MVLRKGGYQFVRRASALLHRTRTPLDRHRYREVFVIRNLVKDLDEEDDDDEGE